MQVGVHKVPVLRNLRAFPVSKYWQQNAKSLAKSFPLPNCCLYFKDRADLRWKSVATIATSFATGR